jgi:hypothetical protein
MIHKASFQAKDELGISSREGVLHYVPSNLLLNHFDEVDGAIQSFDCGRISQKDLRDSKLCVLVYIIRLNIQ